LSQVPGAQTIALRPLSDAHTASLATQLVGDDPSLAALVERVVDRAAGNPFFAEEMVRDLAERGVLDGQPGAYMLRGEVDDVDVPPNLQSTIGARIDRLPAAAKKTLNAASVIGLRFDTDLLGDLVADADVAPLVAAEIVDQVAFTDPAEYAFRHPLTRTVAYESQLKSERAQLHRRLATAIEAHGPADENAALIAQHMEAAGDLHAAFDWHMRAATWSTFRNFAAAQSSWLRAREVADRLPDDDADRLSMRIAPRALLCAHEYRIRSGRADVQFRELKELCAIAGDDRSVAIGLAGLTLAVNLDTGPSASLVLATELVRLVESIGDPSLTISLCVSYLNAILAAGEISFALRLADDVIELSDGVTVGGELISVSPLANALAIRGTGRWCSGLAGWRHDFDRALETIVPIPPQFRSGTYWIVYLMTIPNGVLLPDERAIVDIAEIASAADRFGEQVAIDLARAAHGITLIYREGSDRDAGARILQELHDASRRRGFTIPNNRPLIDVHLAREMGRLGDVDGAIGLARSSVDQNHRSGETIWRAAATAILMDLLLMRRSEADVREAGSVVAKLAAVPTDPAFKLNEIWLLRLRALLAEAEGDEATYREYRDRYRAMANDLGFEGHMKWSAEMV
jgi:adenylate cyclase